MPDGPAWAEGTRGLRELSAGTQLGLHLNLTERLAAGSLATPLPRLVLRAYLGTLNHALVRRELDRQLDAFDAGVGHPPEFIDGHQHVHQLPVVREALIEALDRRDLSERPWLRCTRAPVLTRTAAVPLAARVKARLIAWLGAAALSRLAAAGGYRQNAHLLGVYAFDGSEREYLARLDSWLAVARDGDLLMCHPSVAGGWSDPILPARVREFRALTSPQFAELARRRAIEVRPLPKRDRGIT